MRLTGSFIAALIVITGFVYMFRTTGILARTFGSRTTAVQVEKPRKIEVTIFARTAANAQSVPDAQSVADFAAASTDQAQALTTGAQSVVYSVNRPASTALPTPTLVPISTEASVAPPAEVVPEATPVPEVAAAQPVIEPVSLPPSARLEGIRHQQQSWNNCGPATLSMMLSYFGQNDTQQMIAKQIKPFKDDKNTSPEELVSYATSVGYRARMIQGGDVNLIKSLVANNFPVIVETWFVPEPDDEMGHYQLLVGYDDDVLRFFDSYHGPNVKHTVEEFDPLWKVFNRLAIVMWPEAQDAQMQALLGARWDEQAMLQGALATARAETAANPQDKFAQFNIGTNLLKLGDVAGAVEAYQNARVMKLPWRMLWYQFGVYEANFAQGNYENLVKITSETLKVKAGLEESYFWRARAQAALGKASAARQDLQQALQYRENYAEAQAVLESLP